jgi:hypothetical protein
LRPDWAREWESITKNNKTKNNKKYILWSIPLDSSHTLIANTIVHFISPRYFDDCSKSHL